MIKRILLLTICILFFWSLPCLAATYYVQNGGNDEAAGTEGAPWAYCPGLVGWSPGASGNSISANDTVYFDKGDTWSIGTNTYILTVTGGVHYIGDTWGSGGTRAIILSLGGSPRVEAIVYIDDDDATYDTIVEGFDLDANDLGCAAIVGIGYPSQSQNLTGATKRIENCLIHDNDASNGVFDYGLIVSARGSYEIDDVEFINNTVYNIGEECISAYSETGQSGFNDNILIRGNTVYNSGQDQSGWAIGIIIREDNRNLTLEFNTFYNHTAGGIWLDGSRDQSNIIIRYNISYDNTYGVYCNQSGQIDYEIYGNLIFSNDTYGAAFTQTVTDAANSVLMYNNTFWNDGATDELVINASANFATFEWKNNIAYPSGVTDGGSNITASATNLTTDPNFKNISNLPTGFSGTYGTDMEPDNDGLSTESGDSINNGTDLGGSPYYGAINFSGTDDGFDRDSQGSASWDIGAYEYDAGASAALTGTLADGATEAQIVAGSETLIITLTGDTWIAAGGTFNAQRQAIIDGLDSGGAEAAGWDVEVKGNMAVGEVVRTNATVVTITLAAQASYAITQNETITATIPAAALVESSSPVVATPTFEIEGDPTAALTGTLADNATEAQIVAGGETLIITLSADTWVATVGADNAITTALIAGIDSDGSEAAGWDAEVKANMVFGDVTRNSATQVTILLGAEASYAISVGETITVTIPATALVGSDSAIVVPSTFDITAFLISEGWEGTPSANWPCQDFPNEPCPDRPYNGWEPDSYTCDESVVTGSQQSSAQSHSGSYSFYQKREANEYKVCDIWHDITGSPAKIYIRFYMYLTGNWTNFNAAEVSEFIHLIFTNSAVSGTGFRINLRHHSDDDYEYTCYTGSNNIYVSIQDGSDSGPAAAWSNCYDIYDHLGEWVYVEVMADASNNLVSMWVGDQAIFEDFSMTISQANFTKIAISGFSSNLRSWQGDFYIDDFVVSTSRVGRSAPSTVRSAALTGTIVAGGVTEAEIVAGSETLIITLTNDTWVATVGADNGITDALMAGIDSGGAEGAGWNTEVRDNMVFGDVARTNDTTVTITLGAEASYAITTNETITVTIPASALVESGSAVVATPTFEITAAPDPVAALTGTLSDNATEAQIVTGGETVIITLTNDTWVAAGGVFDAVRQDLIDSLNSAQSETTGWNTEVRDNEVVTAVVRTTDRIVTITLTAQAAYDISANESITMTVDDSALVTSDSPVVATPDFAIIFFDTSTEEVVGMTLQ